MDRREIAAIPPVVVDLERIDNSPGRYCMSFGFDLGPLTRSIEKVGLANSPIVMEDAERHFSVVAGYRRIKVLKSIGWNQIPCRVLPKSQRSQLECFLINLEENLMTRRLNDVEKGMALRHLEGLVTKTEILNDYLPLLDLPSHEETLSLYIKVDQELEEEIKLGLTKGVVSLKATEMLLEMDGGSRVSLFGAIKELRLNSNQQVQFLNYVNDLTRRDSVTAAELLDKNPLRELFGDVRLNNPQKAKALLKILRSSCLPTLVLAEKTFKEKVSAMRLPEGVRIDSPPYFESNLYRLEVLFHDGRQLREKIEQVSMAKGLEELGKPWGGHG